MTLSDSKLWTRALAITSVAAAGILLSGCSLLGQVTGGGGGTGDNPDEGTVDDVFSLVPGDCFNEETDASTVSSVDIVECDVPHAYEAFESIQMSDADYPGDAAAQEQANAECEAPFTEYVGIGWEESIYDYSFYYPTQETWDDPVLQDREILCLIVDDADGLITGSVAGTNK